MKSKHQSRITWSPAQGVTLIELMVTVAVLAIVLGIGVPSFRGLILQQRISSSANEVLAGLASTRSEAIRRNTRFRFCLRTSDFIWELRDCKGNSNCSPDPTVIIRQGTISSDTVTTPANLGTSPVANAQCIDYRSDGLPYRADAGTLITAGSLALSNGSSTKTVHIKTGTIYVD